MKKSLLVVTIITMIVFGTTGFAKTTRKVSKKTTNKVNVAEKSVTKKYIDKILNKRIQLDDTSIIFTKEKGNYVANWSPESYEDDFVEGSLDHKEILKYDVKNDMLFKYYGFKVQENKLALYIPDDNGKLKFSSYIYEEK